jgi:hypothetical protein
MSEEVLSIRLCPGAIMKKQIVLIGVLLCTATLAAQTSWRPLLNGSTLEGWERLNGTAQYSVENGSVVGTSVGGSPNSFLCSKEEFGDFILEFEVFIEPDLNSGVQIRSKSIPTYKEGRVHGYQVEIDASPRGWSGGIYDEGRSGWLYTLDNNERARKAFTVCDWNLVRVEAIGASIRTWINSVPASNILDNTTPRGFIALQVHGVGKDSSLIGKTVRWRKIRIATEDLERYRTPDDETIAQYNYIPNTLTAAEKSDGWTLLWDGRTSEGWRGARLAGFPESGWEMKEGVLSVVETGGGESRAGGDIVTTRTYRNFELSLDFRITTGANSGIKYFVDTELNKGEGSAIGCEYQILDDAVHEDAKKGVNGNRKLSGLYDLIPPVSVRFNGIGEWNRAKIVVKGSHVEHWLNGFRTVAYERGTQMWRALVDHSKYQIWPRFGEALEGHILLQDHGNRVSFRSIKIKAPKGE